LQASLASRDSFACLCIVQETSLQIYDMKLINHLHRLKTIVCPNLQSTTYATAFHLEFLIYARCWGDLECKVWKMHDLENDGPNRSAEKCRTC